MARAAAPLLSGTAISKATSSSARLEGEVNPQGKTTRYRFEYGPADCATHSCAKVPVPEGEVPAGSVPVPIAVDVGGLPAGTLFHFRLVAKNSDGEVEGPDRIFATYATPLVGLPDARAYEQSSPVDKNGEDAEGVVAIVKAAAGGGGITFASTFGIPGGVGAQELPSYLAQREGEAGWSTQGLLPPPAFGERAKVLGWLPDLSATFSNAAKLTTPRVKALVAQTEPFGHSSSVKALTR